MTEAEGKREGGTQRREELRLRAGEVLGLGVLGRKFKLTNGFWGTENLCPPD